MPSKKSNYNGKSKERSVEERHPDSIQNSIIQETENEEPAKTPEKGKKIKRTPQYWKRKKAYNKLKNGCIEKFLMNNLT